MGYVSKLLRYAGYYPLSWFLAYFLVSTRFQGEHVLVTNGLENPNYRGDYWSARINFSMDTWIGFQKNLATTEVVMRTIAAEKQWKFLSNIYGDWPASRLRMKKVFGYSEVGVSLNPNYAHDQQVFYLLTRRDVRSLLGLFERLVHYREIARYSASEIDDPEQLFRILRTAL